VVGWYRSTHFGKSIGVCSKIFGQFKPADFIGKIRPIEKICLCFLRIFFYVARLHWPLFFIYRCPLESFLLFRKSLTMSRRGCFYVICWLSFVVFYVGWVHIWLVTRSRPDWMIIYPELFTVILEYHRAVIWAFVFYFRYQHSTMWLVFLNMQMFCDTLMICHRFQRDFNRLNEWCFDLNPEKCK
jgi:hypothetical protein